MFLPTALKQVQHMTKDRAQTHRDSQKYPKMHVNWENLNSALVPHKVLTGIMENSKKARRLMGQPPQGLEAFPEARVKAKLPTEKIQVCPQVR